MKERMREREKEGGGSGAVAVAAVQGIMLLLWPGRTKRGPGTRELFSRTWRWDLEEGDQVGRAI